MPQTSTYEIFMDASCSFCRWTRERIRPYDPEGRLRFVDYNDPAVGIQAPFPRAELDREMHVRTPEGAWLRGFEAWAAILQALPKLAWLGRVAALPPTCWIGPAFYRFVAKHRYSLPGAPPRCEGDTCLPPTRNHH